MNSRRTGVWAGLALAAGLALRMYFLRKLTHVAGDSLVYGDLATNMLRHHVYGFTEAIGIRPTLIRLPGYPAMLAACFAMFGVENWTTVLWVQVAMDLAACCVLGAVARRLWGERAGLAALWLAALCPFTANYVAAPLTEVPAVLCAAAAFYGLVRWCAERRRLWPWVIGASLSYAVLLRPDRALLAVAVVGAMVWVVGRSFSREGARHIVVVCALIVLPLGLWAVRNWRVFHVVQPLAPKYATDPGERVNYGFDRWYRTWAIDFKATVDVYWPFDGTPLRFEDLPPRAFDNAEQQARTQATYAQYNQTSAATDAVDAQFAALAAERVRAHPLRYYVGLPVAKLADMWLRPRTEMMPIALDWWRYSAHRSDSRKAMGLGLVNLLYLGLAVTGMWRWRQLGVPGWSMVAFVMLRSALLATIDNSEPRYTVDCFAVVVLLGALAAARMSRACDFPE